jgi:hypothetical protein
MNTNRFTENGADDPIHAIDREIEVLELQKANLDRAIAMKMAVKETYLSFLGNKEPHPVEVQQGPIKPKIKHKRKRIYGSMPRDKRAEKITEMFLERGPMSYRDIYDALCEKYGQERIGTLGSLGSVLHEFRDAHDWDYDPITRMHGMKDQIAALQAEWATKQLDRATAPKS